MSLTILFSKEALLQAAHFVLARLVSVASRKPTSVEYGEIKLIKNAARVEFKRGSSIRRGVHAVKRGLHLEGVHLCCDTGMFLSGLIVCCCY